MTFDNLTDFEKKVICDLEVIKVDIARLQERAKIWGAVAGVISGFGSAILLLIIQKVAGQ
jgi:hypothetical protein